METWRGLEDAQELGLVRSIGVSNFNKVQLERVIREGRVKPAVLQIEVIFSGATHKKRIKRVFNNI